MELKGLLGGKGANLAEMSSVLGLPVPPGFTITTKACAAYMLGGWPGDLTEQVDGHVRQLEEQMGKTLGDPQAPLLVSVRSGARFSMPGMMDTVLNLGLNDETVEGLAVQTQDRRFAYDSFRRFIQMYGKIVSGVDGAHFDEVFDSAKDKAGVTADADLDADALLGVIRSYEELVQTQTGAPFPHDPREQLRGAIEAVFRSWNSPRAIAYRRREHIDGNEGTAVNVQAMVFGNRDDNSGTGVGFTRDPATGASGSYGDFLVNAQGEDVVAGIRKTLPLISMQE
ncbi:MAG: PEP/pyruvate-binding domain-containing protein, partial [Microthrixaceae bacterium]